MGRPKALAPRDPARGRPRATRTTRGYAALRASLAGVAIALCCGACAWLPSPLDRPFRKPGQQLTDFPEAVAKEFHCSEQKLPWFKLEKFEVWPKRVKAGGELGHRLVYVLCTARPGDVVTGRLEMRIVHGGKTVISAPEPKYALHPGRWVIDVFVAVPPEASDGLYALELAFKSKAVRFDAAEAFAVEAAAK